jgi:hypothetical protein
MVEVAFPIFGWPFVRNTPETSASDGQTARLPDRDIGVSESTPFSLRVGAFSIKTLDLDSGLMD